jgi:proteasome assembly chaperone (PAC2) family protein
VTLHDLVGWPERVVDPVLVLGLDGWIDAGLGAAGAASQLLQTVDTTLVATFDTEELVDRRSRRPIMHLVDGVNTGMTWAHLELRHGRDPGGHDLLILVGAEPDYRWRPFAREVIDLATRFGVGMVVGLGAYPAPVPHTRPAKLAASASTPELARRAATVHGTLDVPAGVQAAIERQAAEAGIPSVGLWAQVPHYVSAMAYPAASVALLEGLRALCDLDLEVGSLREADRLLQERLDTLVADNPEHQEMVRRLEEHHDAQEAAGFGGDSELPSADELAAEVERFLRGLS